MMSGSAQPTIVTLKTPLLPTSRPRSQRQPQTSGLSKTAKVVQDVLGGIISPGVMTVVLSYLATRALKDGDNYQAMEMDAFSWSVAGFITLPTLFKVVGAISLIEFGLTAMRRCLNLDKATEFAQGISNIHILASLYTAAVITGTILTSVFLPTLLSFQAVNGAFLSSQIMNLGLMLHGAKQAWTEGHKLPAIQTSLFVGMIVNAVSFLCFNSGLGLFPAYGSGYAAAGCAGVNTWINLAKSCKQAWDSSLPATGGRPRGLPGVSAAHCGAPSTEVIKDAMGPAGASALPMRGVAAEKKGSRRDDAPSSHLDCRGKDSESSSSEKPSPGSEQGSVHSDYEP